MFYGVEGVAHLLGPAVTFRDPVERLQVFDGMYFALGAIHILLSTRAADWKQEILESLCNSIPTQCLIEALEFAHL
jgi:hypothetical protein